MAMTIAIDLDISSGSVSLSRPVMELAFDGQISERAAWLRGGHLTTASLEFGGENELSECPSSSAAIIGVGRRQRTRKSRSAAVREQRATLPRPTRLSILFLIATFPLKNLTHSLEC